MGPPLLSTARQPGSVTDTIMTLQRNCVRVDFALITIVNTLFIFFFFFIHKLNPSGNYKVI